jgi:diguanylate cyclase (GGDEF)-like protein/PAS domain S-box-containing protein
MTWLQDLSVLLLIMALALALINAMFAWRLRETPGSKEFTVMLLGVSFWCLGSFVELFANTVHGKMLGCQIQYLGIAPISPCWFLLIARYLKPAEWLTRRRLLLFWVIPLLTIGLIWTNDWHHLMYAHVNLVPPFRLTCLHITYGPWFLVHISYSWLLVAAGLVMLLTSLRKVAPFYRRQLITLLVAALAPYLFNILYVLRIGPFGTFDYTPVAFALSGAGILLALRHFRIIDLSPIAREAVFEGMHDGVLVLDNRQRVLDANPALLALLGGNMEELYGGHAASLFATWLPAEIFAAGGSEQTVQLTDRNGDVRWINLRVSILAKRQGWLLVLRDNTDVHLLQERLNALAFYDELTGLPNRTLAQERMTQELARLRRQQTRMALLYLDLDGFKEINDTLGHTLGDRVLHLVAERLLSCVRACDTVARIGGDEFILILSDLADPEFARITAARILDACADPLHLEEHTAQLTASIGIAIAPDDGMDSDTLLGMADLAMYRAKTHSKNAFMFYSEPAVPMSRVHL